MHRNDYNWYSTNSVKRYHQTVGREPEPFPPTQYSDEGRHQLGSAADPENAEVREYIIECVSEQTIQKWDDFQKEMRDKCIMSNYQNREQPEEVPDRYRSFPQKENTIDEDMMFDTAGGSDASQPPSRPEFDRSKYVLNRKVVPNPTTSSSPQSVESLSDHIFVDDSRPSTENNVRWIVSGDASSTGNFQNREIPPKIAPKQGLTVTVPASSTSTVEECILYKYGHCIYPAICPFAHDGVVKKIEGVKVVAPVWQRKLPSTPICSGYFNYECWNSDCKSRHVIYPSDNVSN